jgi:hypothetical protein
MEPVQRPYPPSLLWDADEAAYHCRICVAHFCRLAAEAGIQPVRLGTRKLYPRAAVEAWVQKLAGGSMIGAAPITPATPTAPCGDKGGEGETGDDDKYDVEL